MATTKIAEANSQNATCSRNARLLLEAPDFDPLARIYRWMEYLSFGPMLERCRFHFLSRCTTARRALVLGDGDGRFTARLLETNRDVQIDAVDSSAAMLAELQRRARHRTADAENRLRIVHADLREFIPVRTPYEGKYDLVVSHFFLDCLTEYDVACMVGRIIPHLAPDATWLISEFAIPEKGWRRSVAQMIVRFLYFAFDKLTHLRVQQIPDYGQSLAYCGFRRHKQVSFLGGLLVTELWQRQDR